TGAAGCLHRCDSMDLQCRHEGGCREPGEAGCRHGKPVVFMDRVDRASDGSGMDPSFAALSSKQGWRVEKYSESFLLEAIGSFVGCFDRAVCSRVDGDFVNLPDRFAGGAPVGDGLHDRVSVLCGSGDPRKTGMPLVEMF